MPNNFKNMFNTVKKDAKDLFEGKSNEELRKIEMQVCKPDILPKYVGNSPEKNPLANRTIKLIFSNEESINVFAKYFKILTYIENNVTDINMLLDFLDLLETNKLEYDSKNREFSWKN